MKKLLVVLSILLTTTFNAQNKPLPKNDKLVGKHKFGVQFIWDGYGSAIISKNGSLFEIQGEQYSNDGNEYCIINGLLKVVNSKTLKFTGNLKILTNDCCGLIDLDGDFTFVKTNNRKFWRLQERDELCDAHTCLYYLDLF